MCGYKIKGDKCEHEVPIPLLNYRFYLVLNIFSSSVVGVGVALDVPPAVFERGTLALLYFCKKIIFVRSLSPLQRRGTSPSSPWYWSGLLDPWPPCVPAQRGSLCPTLHSVSCEWRHYDSSGWTPA